MGGLSASAMGEGLGKRRGGSEGAESCGRCARPAFVLRAPVSNERMGTMGVGAGTSSSSRITPARRTTGVGARSSSSVREVGRRTMGVAAGGSSSGRGRRTTGVGAGASSSEAGLRTMGVGARSSSSEAGLRTMGVGAGASSSEAGLRTMGVGARSSSSEAGLRTTGVGAGVLVSSSSTSTGRRTTAVAPEEPSSEARASASESPASSPLASFKPRAFTRGLVTISVGGAGSEPRPPSGSGSSFFAVSSVVLGAAAGSGGGVASLLAGAGAAFADSRSGRPMTMGTSSGRMSGSVLTSRVSIPSSRAMPITTGASSAPSFAGGGAASSEAAWAAGFAGCLAATAGWDASGMPRLASRFVGVPVIVTSGGSLAASTGTWPRFSSSES
ncbi:hypothetical protein COEX109129_40765 [Corallococcus exiguus]